MSDDNFIQVYDSQGTAYSQAFDVFLAHTDQKANASAWLEQQVAGLARSEVFIDAGAGTGKLTAWLAPRFRRTIAIEPNPSLRDQLRQACPGVEVLPESIAAAQPRVQADFVLCSHVFYYLERGQWAETLGVLAGWLGPDGLLAVGLQNHQTDCMRMLRHFTGDEFDLSSLGREFAQAAEGTFDVRTDTVEAHIQTKTFEAAYIICEFMLNLLPLPRPPRRAELQRYLQDHFRHGEGYRMSCHQDFLRLQRRA